MKVQKITNTIINDVDFQNPSKEKPNKIKKLEELDSKKQVNNVSTSALLKTLENLENNTQMDNSHPLKKTENLPIESFEEALIELSYFKTPFFKVNASAAQANLKNGDVIYLFK